MLEKITFENFKVLRRATLPLGRFTLIVGPNGAGKSSAMQALESANVHSPYLEAANVAAAALREAVSVQFHWGSPHAGWKTSTTWGGPGGTWRSADVQQVQTADPAPAPKALQRFRRFSLDANRLASYTPLTPKAELHSDGYGLAAVLDRLRDEQPERFEALNATLHVWLPEFDRVLFETPQQGTRGFLLRTSIGGHAIPARHLSQGTVLALAILTIAYLPEPPPILCFEEPDRGIHPRLMRDVKDALYRLAYPESCGETRAPTQVIATTHAPYLLDLFRDHLEEVVIANKHADGTATFERLSERPDIDEILGTTPLGDAWYTGVLGGVPNER